MDINKLFTTKDITDLQERLNVPLEDIIERLDYLSDNIDFIENKRMLILFIEGSLISDDKSIWNSLISMIDEYNSGSLSEDDFVDCIENLSNLINIKDNYSAVEEQQRLAELKMEIIKYFNLLKNKLL